MSFAIHQRLATRAAFFIPGFVIATWAPLVPFAKLRAGLDDAALGTVLLCLGVGSLVAMPLAGAAAARVGCRCVMAVTVVMMLLALPWLGTVSSAWSLGATLLIFGAAIGAMDCAMNIQAVAVERDAGRPMMSGFHAFYSIGSLVGAAGATLMLSRGATVIAVVASVMAIAMIIALCAVRAWRPDRVPASGHAVALPRGVVILIGTVCFATFLVEGSMLDWSAVFIHEIRGIDAGRAGWGFVIFNLTMTLTRLVGDRVVAWLGRPRSVLAGGMSACAGLLTATFAPSFEFALLGYALVGMGCANIVPIMFTLAGAQQQVPESIAIPAVTTMGYAGILAGPALIGYVAQGTSLPAAFVVVAIALALAAVVGSRIRVR